MNNDERNNMPDDDEIEALLASEHIPDDSSEVVTADGDPLAPAESVFRLTYRLIEDFQRTRLAQGNRARKVVPSIPENIKPPRGFDSWASVFKISEDILHAEETRLLSLARSLLKQDRVGQWMLAQRGVGPSLAVSILGECWPLSRFRRVRSLWAYAGLHVIVTDGIGKAARRMKGVRKVVTPEEAQAGVKHSFVPVLSCCDKKLGNDVHGDPTVNPEQHLPLPTDMCVFCGLVKAEPNHVKANNWNWRLKTRLYLFACSVIRAKRGPWREVYDKRKSYELLTTPTLRPIDAHRRAMRYTEKMFLKDLWRVANEQEPLIGVVETEK